MKNYTTSTMRPFAMPAVLCGAVRTGIAAVQGSALLPISDVVVFDGVAGIRAWSPPV